MLNLYKCLVAFKLGILMINQILSLIERFFSRLVFQISWLINIQYFFLILVNVWIFTWLFIEKYQTVRGLHVLNTACLNMLKEPSLLCYLLYLHRKIPDRGLLFPSLILLNGQLLYWLSVVCVNEFLFFLPTYSV